MDIPRVWAESLEFQGNNEDFAEFSQNNKAQFNDIQSFIMIVKDWVEELVHEDLQFKSIKKKSAPSRKELSSIQLMNANNEVARKQEA